MEKVSHELLCFVCFSTLPTANVDFCPLCGALLLQQSVLSSKTTSAYDPMARDYKPWREKPLVRKRNYKFFDGQVKPWYPATKSKVNKRAVKVIFQKDQCGPSDPVPNEESIDHTESKELDSNPNLDVKTNNTIIAPEQAQEDSEVLSFREVVYPLAAYELLETPDGSSALMLISLIEQIFGSYALPRLYWLKVSSAFSCEKDREVPLPQIEEENAGIVLPSTETEGSIDLLKAACFPAAYLSNVVLALLHPDKTWIDLDKIDADQFYVAQHLQTNLEYMKYRVKHKYQLKSCPSVIIELNTYNQLVDYHESCQNGDLKIEVFWRLYAAEVYLEQKRITSYSEPNMENNKTYKMMFKSRAVNLNLRELEMFTALDDSLTELHASIRVSRSIPIRFLSVRAVSFLEYRNQLDGSNYQRNSKRLSKRDFIATGVPSHVKIVIYPSDNQTVIDLPTISIPILSMILSSETIDFLLSESRILERILGSTTEADIKEVWNQLILRVLTYIRLEYSSEGIFYSLVGSFSDPVYTSLSWPGNMISDRISDDELH